MIRHRLARVKSLKKSRIGQGKWAKKTEKCAENKPNLSNLMSPVLLPDHLLHLVYINRLELSGSFWLATFVLYQAVTFIKKKLTLQKVIYISRKYRELFVHWRGHLISACKLNLRIFLANHQLPIKHTACGK